MILLPRAVRVYFATQPVSLRRSFDGLSNEVRAVLGHDPLLCIASEYVTSRQVCHREGGFTQVQCLSARHIKFSGFQTVLRTASFGRKRPDRLLKRLLLKSSDLRIISTSASA